MNYMHAVSVVVRINKNGNWQFAADSYAAKVCDATEA
jgi:hypothetical protein